MTPAEIILRKNLVASGLKSEEWERVSAALRDRAFFSSRVESVRFLEEARGLLADLAAQRANAEGAVTSRAQVVSDLMRAARDAGIATGTGGLTDPGSARRAVAVVDTNAGLAAGYCAAEQANTYGARLAFPAQELVRVEQRKMPRDWRSKWTAKGGKLYGGRMIALKGDPIWSKISRFGQPYPPFDFGSGMGVEDVSFDEALALGVVSDDYKPPEKSPLKAFNEGLEAELKMDFRGDAFKELKKSFGDQVVWKDGKAIWRNQLVRDCIENTYGESGRLIKLGKITDAALNKVPENLRETFEGTKGERMGLTITKELATHVKKHGHYKVDTRSSNMPIMPEDLDLIPTMWRDPDRVVIDPRHPEGPVFEFDTPDGGVLRLPIIKMGNTITAGTLYKKRRIRGRADV